MARIDRLIDALSKLGGETLILTSDRPMTFLLGGAVKPMSKLPATTADIMGFLSECAPPQSRSFLTADGDTDFTHQSASGTPVSVHVERRSGQLFVRVRVTGGTAASPSPGATQLTASDGIEALEQLPEAELQPLDVSSADRELTLDSNTAGDLELDVPNDHRLAHRQTSPRAAPPVPRPVASPAAAPMSGPSSPRDLRILLGALISQNGSDLHVSPGSAPRLRLHGELVSLNQAPLTADETEAMFRTALSPEQQKRFELEMSLDFSMHHPVLGRFRATACRQRLGLAMVFRTIPERIPTMADLNLPPAVEALTKFPSGLILVTGPSGCGKTTTQAAIVDRINETWRDHIITVEDPIEFVHPSKQCLINQREIGTHARTFAEALRSALREDPDVILVGELRDLETVQLAITAAETGHLVIGTLHTVDAARTIDRIIDVFPGRQKQQIRAMLSESLRGVISQRLVRTADGKGRIAAFEILLADRSVANLVREGKTFQIPNAIRLGRSRGMSTLDDALLELVKKGKIAAPEAMKHCVNPEEVRRSLASERRPGAVAVGRLTPSAPNRPKG